MKRKTTCWNKYRNFISHKKPQISNLFEGEGNQTNQKRNNSDKFCKKWKETVACAISKQHKNYFKYDASMFGLFSIIWVF